MDIGVKQCLDLRDEETMAYFTTNILYKTYNSYFKHFRNTSPLEELNGRLHILASRITSSYPYYEKKWFNEYHNESDLRHKISLSGCLPFLVRMLPRKHYDEHYIDSIYSTTIPDNDLNTLISISPFKRMRLPDSSLKIKGDIEFSFLNILFPTKEQMMNSFINGYNTCLKIIDQPIENNPNQIISNCMLYNWKLTKKYYPPNPSFMSWDWWIIFLFKRKYYKNMFFLFTLYFFYKKRVYFCKLLK